MRTGFALTDSLTPKGTHGYPWVPKGTGTQGLEKYAGRAGFSLTRIHSSLASIALFGSCSRFCSLQNGPASDHVCILAIILSVCGGFATEQANKSGSTQSIHDSAEKSHIVVKDEHHHCRALLLASYAIVRSGSNGKQGWQP